MINRKGAKYAKTEFTNTKHQFLYYYCMRYRDMPIYSSAHRVTVRSAEIIFFAYFAPLRFYSEFSPRPLRLCGEYIDE
jgi:hypothetical protein